MNFYFYKINHNLDRIYRTAEFFGLKNIYLCQCTNILKGNLFKAKNKSVKRVCIPKLGFVSGLTVESALTIVLWELYSKIYK